MYDIQLTIWRRTMETTTLNYWAVIAAAIAVFVIGGIWYSPFLFAKSWMNAAGLSEYEINNGNKAKIFGFTFVFVLIMAYCLGMFLDDPAIGTGMGAFYGFLTGFGWIFFALATSSLFEQRSWKYIFINGGYWTISFTVMGLILGAWK